MPLDLRAPARATLSCVFALILHPVLAGTPALAIDGNAEHGREIYHACEDCHSIDENDVGPLHRGVVGRRAGSVKDYVYSPELKSSGILWTEAALDRWLTSPQAMVPGTRMTFLLEDPQQRADVIAFLKQYAKIEP